MSTPIVHEQISVVIDGRSIVEAYTKRRWPRDLVIRYPQDVSDAESETDILGMAAAGAITDYESVSLLPGQLGGIIVDPNGAVIPNTRITVTQMDTGAARSVVTDNTGRWIVSNLPSGRVKVTAYAPGFQQLVSEINYDGRQACAGDLCSASWSSDEHRRSDGRQRQRRFEGLTARRAKKCREATICSLCQCNQSSATHFRSSPGSRRRSQGRQLVPFRSAAGARRRNQGGFTYKSK